MNVSQLIEKLKTVDPNLLVCVEDSERGLMADVAAYEITAHVDRSGAFEHPYVDSPSSWRTELHERVFVLTQWGQVDSKEAREL